MSPVSNAVTAAISVPIYYSDTCDVTSVSSRTYYSGVPTKLRACYVLFYGYALKVLSAMCVFSSTFDKEDVRVGDECIDVYFVSIGMTIYGFFSFPNMFFLILFVECNVYDSQCGPRLL